MESKNKSALISVLGADNRIHLANPWDTKTKCGVKIINKKPSYNDISNHYSCYDCSY